MKNNNKYLSITLLSSIALSNNINSMELSQKENPSNITTDQQLSFDKIPAEVILNIIIEVIDRNMNNWNDIFDDFNVVKKNIQADLTNLFNTSRAFAQFNNETDKKNINQIAKTLKQKKLEQLKIKPANQIRTNNKYKGLSKKKLTQEFIRYVNNNYNNGKLSKNVMQNAIGFICAGVNPDTRVEFNDTMSILAAFNGYLDILKLLINLGTDIHIKDDHNQGLLFLAAFNGHTEIVRFLLENTDINVNAQTDFNRSALSTSLIRGHEDIAKLIIQHGGELYEGPMTKEGFKLYCNLTNPKKSKKVNRSNNKHNKKCIIN